MKTKTFLTAGAAVLLFTGCAVLTVDVDVYTGPLANTREVQTEQVISLVMGAKPLLVQLRDHLEVASRPSYEVQTRGAGELIRQRGGLEKEMIRFRAHDWYWAGFVAPSGLDGLHLNNDHALRVNDILVLYDDQTPAVFGALIERGREIVQRYQANQDILFPLDNAADKKSWSRIAPGIKDGSARAAYEAFFVAENGRRVAEPLLVWLRKRHPSAGPIPEFNAALVHYFRTNQVIVKEAEKLFGKDELDDEPAREFFRQADRLLHAYEECRSALHDLALLSVRGLKAVADGGFASAADSNYVAQSVAAFAATVITPSPHWNSTKAGTAWNPAVKALAAEPQPDAKTARAVLEAGMLRDPGTMATSLLELDTQLARQGHDLVSDSGSLSELRLPGDLKQELAYLNQAAGSALNTGRDPKGLETLIDEYRLMAANPTNTTLAKRAQTAEFHCLMDSLVAFGEKVATLGNTDTLLNSGGDAEAHRYVSVLQYVGNAILVHVDELQHWSDHAQRSKRQRPLAVAALRDAGFTNSFLTDTNQLKNMDAKDVLAAEIEALRAAHVKAMSEAGTGTEADPDAAPAHGSPDKFVRALDEAIQMRNGKIYLRPASAYLRSSYPATTLNVNESVGWNNQLERQAWRGIPIIGGLFDSSSRARLTELRELDKQSWQNINRIRVAGAGRVNQVLAKDDIGNWYVKSYSADPTNIIKSARNLAMFSAGNAFKKPLSILTPEGQTQVTNSPFAPQFDRAVADYLARTSNTWWSVTQFLTGDDLSAGISNAWSTAQLTADQIKQLTTAALSKEAKQIYSAPAVQSAEKSPPADATPQKRAQFFESEILSLLGAVKRYHNSVSPKLALESAYETQKARREFTLQLRHYLDDRIAEREKTLERFEGAMQVIQSGTAP